MVITDHFQVLKGNRKAIEALVMISHRRLCYVLRKQKSRELIMRITVAE